MKCEKIFLYEDRTDVFLTTYILEDSPAMLDGGSRPAILIIPGGGYIGFSPREGEPVAMKFNSMGYHAFVLQYSHYWEGVRVDDYDYRKGLPVKEHCQYPKPVWEIGMAMLLIREHAKEWLVNVDQIMLAGFSAGAHMAAMYGTNWNRPLITEHFPANVSSMLRPAAMLLGYGLFDYSLNQEITGEFERAFAKASYVSFLGTAEPDEAILREISPVNYVSPDTPPAFLWATAQDHMVPVENTFRMGAALAKSGVPVEVHVFEQGEHGLALATEAGAGKDWQMNRRAAAWTELAGSWIAERFPLPVGGRKASETENIM